MLTLARLFKRPLIIHCPPRSFSSVLCAMIGMHPELYGSHRVSVS
jgi:hypothetical protein